MSIRPRFALHSVTAAFITAAILTAGRADEGAFSPSRTILIITDKAEVFHGNESVARLPPGSVLRYSKQKGQWLLIPRHRGWLDKDHALPIEGAPRHFDQQIRKNPTPQAWHHRGIARLELGDTRGALADFNQAITAGLKEPGVFINRGVSQERGGNLPAAIEDYTRALQIDPANARAYDNRSGALAALGQYDASLADSNRALEIAPDFAEAWNNAGVTRRMKGEFPKAIENYTRAIDIFPAYAAAFGNRGYAQKALGKFEEALADYREAIRLDPEAPGAHNDLAWLLATGRTESLRDAAAALALAQRACELTRFQNGDYVDTLAAAHAASGDFEKAAAFAAQALELARDDARAAIEQRRELYKSGRAFRE